MNKHGFRAAGVLVASLVIMSGCGRPQANDGSAGGASLTVKGSDTMVHLVSAWAEDFMNSHAGVDVSVTGGGTGTGIKSFINGTTDIAAASRDMSAEEIESTKKAGHEPRAITVARDGIAVAVNPENPVSELTLEQLLKIYTGQYTNWSQVGGPDLAIVALSRESSSGTYVFFQEHVMKKQDYAASVRPLPATAGIIQSVSEDKGAIGYVGLGYASGAGNRVKVVAVKTDASSPAVMPSEETIKSGEYSISRPLYLITVREPSANVKAFVDFTLSDEGQAIVRENEYITAK